MGRRVDSMMLPPQPVESPMFSRIVVAVSLIAVSAVAQNGTVYHTLTNGADAIFAGLGAGGNAQPTDGLGTFVAGEDLRGNRLTSLGDFGFRLGGFVENACVHAPQPTGTYGIKFPAVLFIELSGLNPNVPAIFLNPACTVPSFPLGTSGFIPYGTGPGSSVSFLVQGISSAAAIQLGLPSSGLRFLEPDNGLLGGAGGHAEIVLAVTDSIPIPTTSAGACWWVQFAFAGTSLPLQDDIDGLWHWVQNSPDSNQYWEFSDNEQNIWQSQSVVSEGDFAQTFVFTPNMDYALLLVSPDPCTLATLAPLAASTPYSDWTMNVGNQNGVVLNPNGGFDVGRGSAAISLSGLAGVPNPFTGVGNQDPALLLGTVTTLGFATWEGVFGIPDGSVRVTWLSIDFLGLAGGDPATDPWFTKFGGTVRVPVVSAGFFQPLTSLGFDLFQHVTQPGFVSPLGPGGPALATNIGGASWQVPVPALPAICTGLAMNITYGTSGRTGGLGTAGPLTWDPAIAPVSTTRQLFLFD